MNKKQLNIISYFYLIFPILIFLIGFVKFKFAIIPVLLLIVIFLRRILEKVETNEKFIRKKDIMIIFVIVFLICIFAGQGGLFYQSNDWHCRNAIFRDLINKKWPVYYQNQSYALTYYIGFWMFPALIGKIALCFFGKTVAWKIRKYYMFILVFNWSYIIYFMACKFTKNKENQKNFICNVLFLRI